MWLWIFIRQLHPPPTHPPLTPIRYWHVCLPHEWDVSFVKLSKWIASLYCVQCCVLEDQKKKIIEKVSNKCRSLSCKSARQLLRVNKFATRNSSHPFVVIVSVNIEAFFAVKCRQVLVGWQVSSMRTIQSSWFWTRPAYFMYLILRCKTCIWSEQ